MQVYNSKYLFLSILSILFLFSCSQNGNFQNNIIIQSSNYEDDILYGFEKLTINMGRDYEGDVVTTIIRKKTDLKTDSAFLYIHGFNDYFFQYELADKIEQDGYRFYAIDLRKHGRSLLPNQKESNFRDIKEYYQDIDIALNVMKSEGIKNIILLGHSTGGLISSLYVEDHKDNGIIRLLVLNSPFLDFNLKPFTKNVGVPIVSTIGKFFPNIKNTLKGKDFYNRVISKDMDGEWEINKVWKQPKLEPNYGWVRGIHLAQKRIKKGLTIDIPILVMRSSESHYVFTDKAYQTYDGGDMVLSVKDIAKYSINLGTNITDVVIAKAFHDVFISKKEVRESAYRNMFFWVDAYIDYEDKVVIKKHMKAVSEIF